MNTGRPEAGAYYAALYNTAQTELTALREELAAEKKWYDKEIDEAQQRLTVAEQRNAELERAILTALDDSCEGPGAAEVTIMRIDYDALCGLIAKPTESARQYYYRSDACKAMDSADLECKCWHDEGTGPLFNNPFSTTEPKVWRIKPTESGASE